MVSLNFQVLSFKTMGYLQMRVISCLNVNDKVGT